MVRESAREANSSSVPSAVHIRRGQGAGIRDARNLAGPGSECDGHAHHIADSGIHFHRYSGIAAPHAAGMGIRGGGEGGVPVLFICILIMSLAVFTPAVAVTEGSADVLNAVSLQEVHSATVGIVIYGVIGDLFTDDAIVDMPDEYAGTGNICVVMVHTHPDSGCIAIRKGHLGKGIAGCIPFPVLQEEIFVGGDRNLDGPGYADVFVSRSQFHCGVGGHHDRLDPSQFHLGPHFRVSGHEPAAGMPVRHAAGIHERPSARRRHTVLVVGEGMETHAMSEHLRQDAVQSAKSVVGGHLRDDDAIFEGDSIDGKRSAQVFIEVIQVQVSRGNVVQHPRCFLTDSGMNDHECVIIRKIDITAFLPFAGFHRLAKEFRKLAVGLFFRPPVAVLIELVGHTIRTGCILGPYHITQGHPVFRHGPPVAVERLQVVCEILPVVRRNIPREKIPVMDSGIGIVVAKVKRSPARCGVVIGLLIGEIDPYGENTIFPGIDGRCLGHCQYDQNGKESMFQVSAPKSCRRN